MAYMLSNGLPINGQTKIVPSGSSQRGDHPLSPGANSAFIGPSGLKACVGPLLVLPAVGVTTVLYVSVSPSVPMVSVPKWAPLPAHAFPVRPRAKAPANRTLAVVVFFIVVILYATVTSKHLTVTKWDHATIEKLSHFYHAGLIRLYSAGVTVGNPKQNRVPWPSSLSTCMAAWWSCKIRRTMAKPRPDPWPALFAAR